MIEIPTFNPTSTIIDALTTTSTTSSAATATSTAKVSFRQAIAHTPLSTAIIFSILGGILAVPIFLLTFYIFDRHIRWRLFPNLPPLYGNLFEPDERAAARRAGRPFRDRPDPLRPLLSWPSRSRGPHLHFHINDAGEIVATTVY